MNHSATHNRATHRRPSGRGVMLVEVLLALAITALVATTVASLLFAVSNGTRDQQDLRRRNVRVDVLSNRIDGAIRASSMLLGRDDECLVLWVADARKNGRPDLSELRCIGWNSTTKELIGYAAPADLADADNTTYSLADDFIAVAAAIKGSSTFPAEVWASGVSAWNTTPAAATRQTRLIGYGVTIQTAAGAHAFRSAVTLRGTSGVKG